MTIKKLPPFDLKVGYEWMEPETVMGGEFAEGQYWLDDAKGPIAASSLLATTRSSNIVLPDSAGVYQELGSNTLPRTDRGLYANGQFTNLCPRLNPTVAQLTAAGVTDSAGFAGLPNSVRFAGGEVDRWGFQAPDIATGTPFAAAFLVQMEDGNPPVFGSSAPGSGDNTFRIVVNNSSAAPLSYVTKELLPGIYLVSVVGSAPTQGTFRYFGIAQNATNQNRAFRVCGYQLFAGSFVPDALVPGSSDTGGATLFASDIRAVQGVRPSNSQPEPFPGWEAAGLDGQYKKKFRVSVDWLNDAAERTISVIGVDAQNKMRLFLDTDNRIKGVLTKLGPELAPDTTPNLNIYRAPDVPIISYNSGSILIAGREYRISYVVSENVGNNSTNLYVGGAQVTAGRISGGVNGSFTVNAAVSVSPVNLAVSLSPAGNVVDLMLDTISIREAVEYVVLQSDPITVLGEYEIELDAKPGAYALRVSNGIEGDASTSNEPLPDGISVMKVGSDIDGTNPFNGWIKNVQVVKVE